MYEHKVIITKDQSIINAFLTEGWFVISVTAQHVSVAANSLPAAGAFCFVLKK